MTETIIDQALEIIRATHDGDDLDPHDLKLTEHAVNGLLNDTGKAAFEALLAHVRAGYVKPWFHRVEHVTRNHDGYVFYKSHRIEHFSPQYAISEDAKLYAQKLAASCRALEAKGITPSFKTINAQDPTA